MAEMTRIASVSLGSEFNAFLFAPIREDRNGMPLSVLSALARLDVDPWQEAAALARMPGETATQRLAAMIAALPDEPSALPAPGTIAPRLIALLPRRAGSNIGSSEALLDAHSVINARAIIYVTFIFMYFLLLAQGIMASRQPQAQVENAHAPAPTTVVPKVPPPSSGQ